MKTGKYIYCIIGTDKDMKFGPSRINDFESEIYTICHKDIAACVSDLPFLDYRPTRRNAIAQAQVIEKIMKEFTILPLRGGTICEGEAAVKKLLEKSYEELKIKLQEMKGKVELNIMAMWKEDGIQREAEERHSNILRSRGGILAKPHIATPSAVVKLGEKVERTVSGWREEYKKVIRNIFSECIEDFCFNKTIDIRMVLNAAFLVRKEKEKDFDKKVNELGEKYGYKIKLRYSGPFPPYNFVDIKLNPD